MGLSYSLGMNVHEAKTNFSRLLAEVQAGKEVVITKAGRPVAKLVPFNGRGQRRVPGGWEGRMTMATDFDEVDAELVGDFEGGGA
jgi:prevent-host-death family protein